VRGRLPRFIPSVVDAWTYTAQFNYSNEPVRELTMSAILDGIKAVEALPKVATEITVSCDIFEQVSALAREHATGAGSMIVHADGRLPSGTWHEGAPK
jgi:hypothetical protein